ncbi:MAG: SDR family oxidoreductase [Candidatus Lumbricidophila eiseniae]|uniref:SDR family oxidoreductase n=1 Tax=Candidatus Lumbricidiphila eiseniae TaxID=1969409 RepID=A0A2A6FSB3_9MICO|nr:MAG: SDR family oxidoreductase [Candidatus Lumbricidophila eiseniae]
MGNPESQRVVITGISRGIGRATALAFARQGARVAGLHRNKNPRVTTDIEAAIRTAGGEPLIHVGNVSSTADIDRLATTAAGKWGGIDTWVNNAAQLFVKPFLDTTDEEWDRILNSNFLGYVRGARAAARFMVPAQHGQIINVGSAVEVLPPTDMTVYVSAKGAISSLTRALAVELGPSGVTVNTLAPGATDTPLNDESWTEEVRETYRSRIPLHRIAGSDDIADAIVAFSSHSMRYVTGQVIFVDGGLTLNGSVGHREVTTDL